jgi:hypothetical protein
MSHITQVLCMLLISNARPILTRYKWFDGRKIEVLRSQLMPQCDFQERFAELQPRDGETTKLAE